MTEILWFLTYPSTASKRQLFRPNVGRSEQDARKKLEHLWFHEYEDLRKENEGLVRSYEEKWYINLARPEDQQRVRDGNLQGLLEEVVSEQAGELGSAVKKIVSTIIENKDSVSQAVAGRPYAQLAWGGVLALLMAASRVLTEPQHAIEGLDLVTNILLRHHLEQINFKSLYEATILEGANAIKCSEYLMNNTIKLYTGILEYQIRLAEQCYSHRVIVDDWGDMTKKLRSVDKRIVQELKAQKEARGQIERRLHEMHPVTRATWARLKEEPICHEGTRTEIRRRIHEWSEDSKAKPILWLSGLPGTAIGSKKNIQDRSVEDQWQDFIHGPLSSLEAISPKPIIILDAVDEIEMEDETVGHLLQRLSETERLVFLISCRSESPSRFQGLEHMVQELKLGKVDVSNKAENDMTSVIRHELAKISAGLPDLAPDVLGQKTIKDLASKTEGFSVYASFICRFLKTADRKGQLKRRLELILAEKPTSGPSMSMNQLYAEILGHVITKDLEDDEEVSSLFQRLVGAMVVLRQPLSVPSLSRLISVSDEDSDYIISKLRSVIEIADSECPPSFIHESFKEYLLDNTRCLDPIFHIRKETQHGELFRSCMRVMSETMNGDVRHVQDSSSTRASPREQLPQYVEYACMFWVEHLSRSGLAFKSESHTVENFLKRHLLHSSLDNHY
ncbi:hypothetical protein BO94DRAFT_612947 [Aspergillus sclerotioniger CBS 115572]|uniref:NWD NACHT-NTPase N-terminal domain-containing protein n=1 Tax=Aspergillus sclerotioniger CBS 115572 TaxID=1450535 RepID=A0A317XB24_9EURO|nr:hypothetical protein BO94DRAFT_612947 [Aspergillus sclerotioniger CBS 115572]PWY94148.1 hypothetical protein BO94DRAFT_612947 [Aspergillus sclerotioniger CBS 115572]